MLEIGQQVRVLEPFARDFPDVYTIEDIIVNDNGTIVYILGEGLGFDIFYLETV